jgi:hypothetical protein
VIVNDRLGSRTRLRCFSCGFKSRTRSWRPQTASENKSRQKIRSQICILSCIYTSEVPSRQKLYLPWLFGCHDLKRDKVRGHIAQEANLSTYFAIFFVPIASFKRSSKLPIFDPGHHGSQAGDQTEE